MKEYETIIYSYPIYVWYDKSSDLYYLVIKFYSDEFYIPITTEQARRISLLINLR